MKGVLGEPDLFEEIPKRTRACIFSYEETNIPSMDRCDRRFFSSLWRVVLALMVVISFLWYSVGRKIVGAGVTRIGFLARIGK